MQGEVRTGVLSFALCFTVAGATGCSSDSEPAHEEMLLGCTTDLDCASIGSGSTCESGRCLLPSTLGTGGGPSGGPPAQGAVAEGIAPTPGGPGCQASSAPFFAPPNADPVNGTAQTLNCDLTVPGCNPNANVVVDGAQGATVRCTVGGGPDSFNVNATLSQGDVAFSVQGTLTTVGGKAFVSSNHAQFRLQDPSCDIFIASNQGEIIPGAIWAVFNCPAFGDPSSAAGAGCTATGKFLFENCSK